MQRDEEIAWTSRGSGKNPQANLALPEGFAQKLDALRNALLGRSLALELDRYVSVVPDFGQNLGNARVVEVEGVPFPTPEIGLGLNESSKG